MIFEIIEDNGTQESNEPVVNVSVKVGEKLTWTVED